MAGFVGFGWLASCAVITVSVTKILEKKIFTFLFFLYLLRGDSPNASSLWVLIRSETKHEMVCLPLLVIL